MQHGCISTLSRNPQYTAFNIELTALARASPSGVDGSVVIYLPYVCFLTSSFDAAFALLSGGIL